MEFEDIEIGNTAELNLLLNKQEFLEALDTEGFCVNTQGFLTDKKTNQPVKSEDGKEIKVSVENQLALYKGSYHFVRNIAELSLFLAKNDKIKFIQKGNM